MNIINFDNLPFLFDSTEEKVIDKESIKAMVEKINKGINFESMIQKSILGLDILEYSQFPEPQQSLIPKVFELLVDQALKDLKEYEPFLFQGNQDISNVSKTFIDMGDGGFFILDTPLHALFLGIYIESALRQFNSYFLHSTLRNITGAIKLRYSITYDLVYQYQNSNKFYGPAIIHCARIMSKDKLDRCLIDENSNQWFMEKLHGIETLKFMPFNVLEKIFSQYQASSKELNSYCVPNDRTTKTIGIDSVEIMKIGEIKAKKNLLSIYNIHLQMSFYYRYFDENDASKELEGRRQYFTISLGNLNPEGISKE